MSAAKKQKLGNSKTAREIITDLRSPLVSDRDIRDKLKFLSVKIDDTEELEDIIASQLNEISNLKVNESQLNERINRLQKVQNSLVESMHSNRATLQAYKCV